jgi:DAK2 domain fusion protein YloV
MAVTIPAAGAPLRFRLMLDRLEAADLRSVIVGYRDALRAHQERLNRLNVYPVPDGDTGTNMALTLESVVSELDDAGEDMAAVCRAVSHGSLMGARGNSGVILCQVLRGLTDRCKTEDALDGSVLAEALAAASTAAYQAVLRPVEGTILTVVREAAEAAQVAAKEPDATLGKVLDAAAGAGAESLSRTPELLPVLAEAGVVDAGGAGFLLLLDVLLHLACDRPVPVADSPSATPAATPAPKPSTGAHDPVGDLRYEVMFFLEASDEEAVAGFKRAWAAIGDSIVVVGGDGVWNCHIHTDDVDAAIQAAIDAGRPRRIQVTDLAAQVADESCAATAPTPVEAPSGTAVVAVAAGPGAISILRSLGVQAIVTGGQSMNPSTAELLEAVERTAAAEVVLLPNNKNVVAVAQQAVEMATKPVRVVGTTSLAEAFAALMGFDPDADADANARDMVDAAKHVRWGEVTWAVRDASTAAGAVRQGDHIGLLGHDIVATAPDVADAACALLDRLVDGDHELVTLVEGEAATPNATDRITAWLREHRPDVAVEVHDGGQPLSAYLISAE